MSEEQQQSSSTGVSMGTSAGLKFPSPKVFDGKEENWDSFQYKFRAYLCLADPRFRGLFNTIEENPNDPVDLELEADGVDILAAQLPNALMPLTDGPAAKLVQRQEKTENGLESWRIPYQAYAPSKRSKTTSQMMKILTWRVDMSNFENNFNV